MTAITPSPCSPGHFFPREQSFDPGATTGNELVDVLCIGVLYGLLVVLASAAPFVILFFVRASAMLRIAMVISAVALGLMALYGVVLLEGPLALGQ